MATDAHAEQSHGSPLGPREYIYITIGLALVTLVELALSYSDLSAGPLAAILIVLSAAKFIVVVALFMHLKFESRIFTQMFMFGLLLGSAILLALIALFWNDPSDALGGKELPPLEHHDEAHQLFLDTERLV
jgi:heme/copper-type cytochrome/quinol oxidase subunit 4